MTPPYILNTRVPIGVGCRAQWFFLYLTLCSGQNINIHKCIKFNFLFMIYKYHTMYKSSLGSFRAIWTVQIHTLFSSRAWVSHSSAIHTPLLSTVLFTTHTILSLTTVNCCIGLIHPSTVTTHSLITH